VIEIDHRLDSVYGARWEFSSDSHPSIVGGGPTLDDSIDAAYRAARHCIERATGGITVGAQHPLIALPESESSGTSTAGIEEAGADRNDHPPATLWIP
jgi:hypothetical protein